MGQCKSDHWKKLFCKGFILNFVYFVVHRLCHNIFLQELTFCDCNACVLADAELEAYQAHRDKLEMSLRPGQSPARVTGRPSASASASSRATRSRAAAKDRSLRLAREGLSAGAAAPAAGRARCGVGPCGRGAVGRSAREQIPRASRFVFGRDPFVHALPLRSCRWLSSILLLLFQFRFVWQR